MTQTRKETSRIKPNWPVIKRDVPQGPTLPSFAGGFLDCSRKLTNLEMHKPAGDSASLVSDMPETLHARRYSGPSPPKCDPIGLAFEGLCHGTSEVVSLSSNHYSRQSRYLGRTTLGSRKTSYEAVDLFQCSRKRGMLKPSVTTLRRARHGGGSFSKVAVFGGPLFD